jgi:hypothetical protein
VQNFGGALLHFYICHRFNIVSAAELALHNIEKYTGPHLDGIHMLWKSRPQHK